VTDPDREARKRLTYDFSRALDFLFTDEARSKAKEAVLKEVLPGLYPAFMTDKEEFKCNEHVHSRKLANLPAR
jgi:hypothetical protein